jgi:hypothetical protein
MEIAGQPGAPVVAADEEVREVRERSVVDGVRRGAVQPGGANDGQSSMPSRTPRASGSASAMVARRKRIESSRVTS